MWKKSFKNQLLSNFLTLFILLISGINSALGSDYQSPRTMGLGGAGHAGPLLNDSIYMNASYTSFVPYRSFSANYLWHGSDAVNASGQSATRGMGYNISILDGTRDSLFQAGVGFTRRGDGAILHIGASKSILDRLGFGLGTKIIFPMGTNERLFDTTLSVTGLASQWFQANLMVDNVLQTNQSRGFYREFILGTKVNVMSIFSIFLDPHWTPALPSGQKFGYEAGLEFTVMSDFFLRAGAFHNSFIPFELARGSGYGFGVGWLAPKLSIDYGLTRVIEPTLAIAHQVGVSVYF